jgi:hypothetical protein
MSVVVAVVVLVAGLVLGAGSTGLMLIAAYLLAAVSGVQAIGG